MTKILLLTTAFLAFFALGCTDNFGPIQTVKSAYGSLEKNQTQDFISLLSGEALTTYGTADGIVALQRALSGLNLQVGKGALVSTDTGNDTETWSVPVNTTDSPSVLILTAQVLCDIGYVNGTESKVCTITSIVLED